VVTRRAVLYIDVNGLASRAEYFIVTTHFDEPLWPAPGSADTELGVLMELEVRHGETEVYP
jgi:hypothetical protein